MKPSVAYVVSTLRNPIRSIKKVDWWYQIPRDIPCLRMQEASYVVMRNGIKRQPPRSLTENGRRENGKRMGKDRGSVGNKPTNNNIILNYVHNLGRYVGSNIALSSYAYRPCPGSRQRGLSWLWLWLWLYSYLSQVYVPRYNYMHVCTGVAFCCRQFDHRVMRMDDDEAGGQPPWWEHTVDLSLPYSPTYIHTYRLWLQ